MASLLIGEVAHQVGVSAPTIRYYESLGLLSAARRTTAGYRRYSAATVEELRFIKKAQGLGFSLDEIGEILKLTRAGQTPCSHVLSLGHRHLAAVEERISQLQRFRELLRVELTKWEEQETAVTCGGLCQFIVDADAGTVTPDSVNVARHSKPPAARPGRKARA